MFYSDDRTHWLKEEINMKKKLLSLLLVAGMTLSLVACGGGDVGARDWRLILCGSGMLQNLRHFWWWKFVELICFL